MIPDYMECEHCFREFPNFEEYGTCLGCDKYFCKDCCAKVFVRHNVYEYMKKHIEEDIHYECIYCTQYLPERKFTDENIIDGCLELLGITIEEAEEKIKGLLKGYNHVCDSCGYKCDNLKSKHYDNTKCCYDECRFDPCDPCKIREKLR